MKKFIKKLLIPLFALFFVFGMSACTGTEEGGEPGGNGNDNPEIEQPETPPEQQTLNISLHDKTFTYDGKSHSLDLTGDIPSDIEIEFSNNSHSDVGSYTVSCSISDKAGKYHPLNLSATLTIAKANYDLSKIKFEDKTVYYDGNTHPLAIEGELPEGLTVEYQNNDNKLVGKHTVKAIFTNKNLNYVTPDPMTATLTINHYDFDPLSLEYSNLESVYTGKEIAAEVTNLPENYVVTYENNKQTNVGTYQFIVQIKDKNNPTVEIAPITKEMVIKKAHYDMSGISFNDKTVAYEWGVLHKIEVEGDLPSWITVTYEHNEIATPHKATAVAHFNHENPNYYPIDDMSATFIVTKADLDLSLLKYEDLTVPYDKRSHMVKIEGDTSLYNVEYLRGSEITAGTYLQKVKLTNKYPYYNDIDVTLEATLTITKSNAPLGTLRFNDKVVTYDGRRHRIYVEGDYDKNYTITFENNDQVKAGTYEVICNVNTHDDSYLPVPPLKATLEIRKAAAPSITIEDKTVYYDGKPHSIDIIGLPENEFNYYFDEKAEQTEVGVYYYNIHFESMGNYQNLLPRTAYLTIKQSPLPDIEFDNLNTTYDGSVKEVVATNLPDKVEITFTNNANTNAGTYEIGYKIVSTNGGYEDKEGVLTQVISPKVIDLSNIKFNNKEVRYNNKIQQNLIEGTLPEGISVEYKNNNNKNAGLYNVEALFTADDKNFAPSVSSLKADLRIWCAYFDMNRVHFGQDTFDYDGKEHSLEVTIDGAEDEDYINIEYLNNNKKYIGVYEVTIKFHLYNYEYVEDITHTLTINSLKLDLTKFDLSEQVIDYDGKRHQPVITVPEEYKDLVTITIDNTYCTYPGDYVYNVDFNINSYAYDKVPTQKIKFKINHIKIDTSKITLKYSSIVYNGKENTPIIVNNTGVKSLGINNVDNKTYKNVGVYDVTLKLKYDTTLYKADKDIIVRKFEITKYDMTDVKFENAKFTYNGKKKAIEVTGLPSFVYANYSNNYVTEPGTYTVTATLNFDEKNINGPKTLTATLDILDSGVPVYVTFQCERYNVVKKYYQGTIIDDIPLWNKECANNPNFVPTFKFINYDEVATEDCIVKDIIGANDNEPYTLTIIDIIDGKEVVSTSTITYLDKIDLKTFNIPEHYKALEAKEGQYRIWNVMQSRNDRTITRTLEKSKMVVEYYVNNKIIKHLAVEGSYKVENLQSIGKWNTTDGFYYADYIVKPGKFDTLILWDNTSNLSLPKYEKEFDDVNLTVNIVDLPIDEVNIIIPKVILNKGKFYTVKEISRKSVEDNNITKSLFVEGNVVIHPNTFKNFKTLESATIKNAKSVGNNAFENCDKLNDIWFNVENNEIAFETFKNCTSLASFSQTKPIYTINENAFMNCTTLRYVDFTAMKTKYIGKHAFMGCSNFGSNNQHLNLALVEVLDLEAFKDCINIKTMDIACLKAFNNPFEGCSSLQTIYYSHGNHFVDIINMDPTKSLFYHNASLYYHTSSGVILANNFIFNNQYYGKTGALTGYKYFDMYRGVELQVNDTIYSYQFNDNGKLVVFITNNIKHIESNAFVNNPQVELRIRSENMDVANDAFTNSKISKVTFEKVKSIDVSLINKIPDLDTINMNSEVTEFKNINPNVISSKKIRINYNGTKEQFMAIKGVQDLNFNYDLYIKNQLVKL